MKYGDWTCKEDHDLLDILGGVDVARRIIQGRQTASPKYNPSWGQIEAVQNKLGQEKWQALLRDDIEIEITFKEVSGALFDSNNRFIPRGLSSSFCDADTNFKDLPLENVDLNFIATVLKEARTNFQSDAFLSAEECWQRYSALKDKLSADRQLANALILHYPVFFSKVPQVEKDAGRAIEEVYLAAFERFYKNTYPNRAFMNHRKGTLAGNVGVVSELQKQLIAKIAKGPQVGIYCLPFQGFSINADREVEEKGLIPMGQLAGLGDLVAIAEYPEQLAYGWKSVGIDCAPFSFQSVARSLNFKACGAGSDFGRTDGLADPRDDYSAGWLVLG